MKLNSLILLWAVDLRVTIARAYPERRPPAAKPLPPGANWTAETGDELKPTNIHDKSCGLDIPTRRAWDQGVGKEVAKFLDDQWTAYLWNRGYQSFPLYMRAKFAPNAPPGAFICDGIATCTLGSCLNLNTSKSIHERQMAYYDFESISNVVYFLEKTRRATDDATEYQLGKMKQNVDTYTSAKYIVKKLADRQKENAAILSAVTALMLLSTALLTAAPLFGEAALLGSSLVKYGAHLEEDAIKELGEINQIAGVVSNLFIGLTGALKDVRDNPHLSDDLVSLMSISWNELAHKATDSIASDVVDLMKGALNSQGQDLRQLIKSGQFVEADPQMYIKLKEVIDGYYQAVMINNVWKFERAYILDTNSVPHGNCEADIRGPKYNRVCLDDHPDRSYWLYSIDQSEEYDKGKKHQAHVHGPIGYRNFLPDANSTVHNMTKEDIVRSSIWIDENGFEDAITAEKPNITRLMESMIDANKSLGKFPGAFAVPICRNPGGEAISSVWTKSGRNYPCKCGEVSWSDKEYDWTRDKTRKFLERTSFKFSEDWEDYCSDNNKCKGDNDIDWNFWAGPQEGKIPKKLKHPFKTCKSPKEHQWGHPEEDPGVRGWKREVEEMTWQEVQRAELELWAKQLEERQTGWDRNKERLATCTTPARVRS